MKGQKNSGPIEEDFRRSGGFSRFLALQANTTNEDNSNKCKREERLTFL